MVRRTSACSSSSGGGGAVVESTSEREIEEGIGVLDVVPSKPLPNSRVAARISARLRYCLKRNNASRSVRARIPMAKRAIAVEKPKR